MANPGQRFEADRQYAYRALQDARAYVTDTDRNGIGARAIYERLARARGMMYPWSTDGRPTESEKAIEYLREITSILSEKIGPASRCEFPEQDDCADPPTKKSPAQIRREIDASLAGAQNATPHRDGYPNDLLPGDVVMRRDIKGKSKFVVSHTGRSGGFTQVFARKVGSGGGIVTFDRSQLRTA